jgi:hypothetical protein
MVVVRILLAAAVSASASPAARESPLPVVAPAGMTTGVFPPRMAHGYRTLHVPLGRLALDAASDPSGR